MIYAQDRKLVNVLVPASATAGATSTGTVDLQDCDYCQLIWHIATIANTALMPTVCKVQESNDLTTYADIVAFTGGTATSTSVGFVIPAGHATVSQLYAMNIDCRSRRRYLKISLSPAATQINAVIAVLDRIHPAMPDTIAEAGVALQVNG